MLTKGTGYKLNDMNLREYLSDWGGRQHLDKEIGTLSVNTEHRGETIHHHSLGGRVEGLTPNTLSQKSLQPINHHKSDSFLSVYFFFSQISLLLAFCLSVQVPLRWPLFFFPHPQHMRVFSVLCFIDSANLWILLIFHCVQSCVECYGTCAFAL